LVHLHVRRNILMGVGGGGEGGGELAPLNIKRDSASPPPSQAVRLVLWASVSVEHALHLAAVRYLSRHFSRLFARFHKTLLFI
jgi:hypothetical protein